VGVAVSLVFHTCLFGRRWLPSRAIGDAVACWDRRAGREAPLPAEAWDAQYARGQWDYLGELRELSRYSVVVGYLAFLAPRGAVLDVGCGAGLLFQRSRPYGYARYVGVDLSAVAVARLAPLQDERTRFLHADAETFVPQGRFDAIVFSECLYYFVDPLGAVARYATALEPGGQLLLSTYEHSPRAMAILRRLAARYPVLDETRVAQGPRAWRCTVLRPHGAPEAAACA
jgi:SAM-dependent methyltransferase